LTKIARSLLRLPEIENVNTVSIENVISLGDGFQV